MKSKWFRLSAKTERQLLRFPLCGFTLRFLAIVGDRDPLAYHHSSILFSQIPIQTKNRCDGISPLFFWGIPATECAYFWGLFSS
jgi:hypothetical protein